MTCHGQMYPVLCCEHSLSIRTTICPILALPRSIRLSSTFPRTPLLPPPFCLFLVHILDDIFSSLFLQFLLLLLTMTYRLHGRAMRVGLLLSAAALLGGFGGWMISKKIFLIGALFIAYASSQVIFCSAALSFLQA